MSKYKTAKPGLIHVLTFKVKRHSLCPLNSMKRSSVKFHNNNPVLFLIPLKSWGKQQHKYSPVVI